MVEGEQPQDQAAVRAAKILVGLRRRELRGPPEWVPLPPPAGEASSAATEKVAEVPEWWPRKPRSKMPRRRDELCPAAAAGSGPSSSRGVDGSPAGAGSTPPTTTSAAAAAAAAAPWARPPPRLAEAMKASSPDTPLDYGAGGSGASSSADDAGAKRKALGSGAGACSGDDEGCSSPAKRARQAAAEAEEEAKPIRAPVVEPPGSKQSGACAPSSSGGKGAGAGGLAIDLNLPWREEDDPDAC